MTQYIKKLPAVFQTVTERKFFDATFDQVFSKKDSDYLAGYLGRRDPGFYNPISDFYLPEPSKNRTWWQLEPTAYSRNAESEKTNIFFYDDLLERIEYYGGNTLNQDRLFESEYYSFGPPIDYDMFINYQNYYWVEQGLPTINISGVLATDIIGKSSYTTPPTATPPNLTLTTGMTILLVDDPLNLEPLIVENFGNCRGIGLVPQFPDFTSGTLFEFLPWDGILELSNGRLINNQFWDATSWDTQAMPSYGDYITIERGAQDRNAWSRTNKWFHIDAINATVAATGIAFPSNASRALRPIIQFIADLELYKSGTQFRDEIQYGFRDDAFGFPILLSDYQNQQLSFINANLDIVMQDGDLVCFMNDLAPVVANFYPWDTANWDIAPFTEWDAGDFTTMSHYIFQANLQGDGTINFAPYTSWATPVLEGDIVFITEDAPWNGAQRGQTWYFSMGIWQKAYNDKVSVNQPPLFLLYDHNGIPLDDPVTYPESTFYGSEIFSYKVNSEPGATVDPVLKFPIIYTGLGQATDIVFQNDLITERYTYTSDRMDIDGYYYYKLITEPILYNNWNLYQPCQCEDNGSAPTFESFVSGPGQTIFNTSLNTIANSPTQSYLQVFVNGVFQREGVTGAYQVTGANQITFNIGLASNDDVVIYSSSEIAIPPDYESFISLAAQTIFNTTLATLPAALDKSYLQVYVNGVFQLEGITGAYQVTGPNQITFNAALALNDDVVIFGYSLVDNPPDYNTVPALAAQTIFNTTIPTLPAGYGQSYLQVLVNGVYQLEGVTENYTVTGPNQITFNTALALNDDVVIFGIDLGSGPVFCPATSKQRVIDKYAVGYGTEYQFKLSVTPYGYVIGGGPYQPLADVIVSVNDTEILPLDLLTNPNGYTFIEINNNIYVDLELYLTTLFTTTQTVVPVVEIQTYTHGLLDPAATGYFAIPQQLEANPTQLEVSEISASDLIPQFSSIIANQPGFTGVAFGGNNNYRDLGKNRTLGTFILQNVAPILKSMLVSSSDDLDFILAERFSQDEYTKFKNRYLSTAKQLINQEFSPVQYNNNTIVISAWVGEILRILNISKEFSNAFAYSYMAAQGSPFANQSFTGSGNSLVTLTDYVDLNDPRNVLYVYDVTNPTQEQILLVGIDYEIISTNLSIDVQLNLGVGIKDVYFTLYKEPLPTYIPSTPTKIGAYPIYIPRIELDATYVNPTNVIIGHDGSKTIAYGDYRDDLLLELEKRIYNGLQLRLRDQYRVPLRVESVETGYFRQTRYSRQEFLDITVSYLNKWSAKNRANYRTNEWPTASLEPSVVPSFVPGVGNIWKLYNYTDAVTPTGDALDLPGNWKGIFQYYYDTYNPDTQPWNMLGFSDEPSWWRFEYGNPVLNLAGQEVWTSTAAGNNNMWADLEDGIIRQGPCAIYNPITLIVQPQKMWARPGLSTLIPVDAAGEIIPVMTLFNVAFSGNYYAPFDGFEKDWVYGDGSPVEQAWMSTSAYAFSVQEFLYLMRPGPYGELMFDTIGTELSPDMITIPTTGPDLTTTVMSSINWQYVQNDLYTDDDPFFAWMRPKNADQLVHAESVDGIIQIRFGYQRWISDRILLLGKDVSSTFGQKVRTLDVNLANKLAGFTNKDTTNMYLESITGGSTTNSLIIPATNFDVFLHKSPVVDTYIYSGVVIRALADGTFVVYGYDLLHSEFTVFDRSTAKLIDVTVGGTPAPFHYFTPGATYVQGDIVRYNGVFYISLVTQTVQKFEASGYQKLKALPIVGGVSVTYKPESLTTITKIPYGSILNNAQEVFDMLIGWGAWLASRGWKFDEVNQDTNLLSDWLGSAKQFLFWLNTEWAPDASIQLSPLANRATLEAIRGYPEDVEAISNGVYSILDKFGVAIPPNGTTTDRQGVTITVEPADLASGGIYFLQVNTTETEHILIFDNVTNFNDIVYSPLLRSRQQRLRFNGFRSNGWYGKMEAPGYLIIEDQLVPNYDSIVDAMRYYYDPNVALDNPSLEDLGRHLIGYESKSYLDNLQVSNDVQYLFYQGAIRQKGTSQAFEKLFRSTKVQSDEIIEVFEEWALKLGDFGNTVEQVSTEFILKPEQNTGEVIVARMNYVPSEIGVVRLINIVNAENTYIQVPRIIVDRPDPTPNSPWIDFSTAAVYGVGTVARIVNDTGNFVYYSSNIVQGPGPFVEANWTLTLETRTAKAYAVLDTAGRISRVEIIDQGYGYLSAPDVDINSGLEPNNLDKLYSVWQGLIVRDPTLDNIVNIDIDQVDKWIVRPTDTELSLGFPLTDRIEYPLPNAGYVNFNDVDWSSFDVSQTAVNWGTSVLNPAENDTVWIAKTFTEDWSVYKLVNENQWFDVWKNEADELFLRTLPGYLITPQLTNGANDTDFGNMVVLQVIEAQATPIIDDGEPSSNATATATIIHAATATASSPTAPPFGEIHFITVTTAGAGYTFIPTVIISDPPVGGTTATAIANIVDGVIVSIDITNTGSGYLVAPTVTIENPYNVGQILELNPVNIGSGYIVPPGVTILGDGAGATASSVITDGQVTGFTIITPGTGYTIATVSITASPQSPGAITSAIINKTGANYTSAPAVTIIGDGVGATAEAVAVSGAISELNITNTGSGYTFAIIQIAPPPTLSGENNFALGFAFNQTQTDIDPTYNYYNLLTLNANPITLNEVPNYENFTRLMLFKTMRFLVEPGVGTPSYVSLGDHIWVDGVDLTPPHWNVYTSVVPTIQIPTGHQIFRTQEPLINTSLFESASVFGTRTGTELIQLPVYDPFKNILPGPAKQNITYTSMQDPARYNVTADPRLFNENITFGPRQVGQLWWDLSATRYVYYEQPISYNADGTPAESEVDNLVYRRDHWGQIFPGGTVNIYEWVESDVVPELYTGTGTPRDITTYVQIVTSNRFTSATEVKYYFWVLNTTNIPNVENRTMAALDVSRLLQSPKSQGFAFFSPIQQLLTNNSYMFYNVQEILAYQGNNIQVQYRLTERDDQEHTQWQFFREGDPNSIVTDQYWNKMVDSLCAWTKVLPTSDEWLYGIPVGFDIPWDILGWDTTAWDVSFYGEILPVPDPTLSEAEKYGIEYRPRQGMFIRIHDARKVFVQSANELLSHIPVRDDNPGWNAGVTTDDYWTYTNWYKVGYEDAIPTIVFSTLADANAALVAGQLQVGTILQVTQGTLDGRFVLYNVVQLNPNIPALSLEEVAIENSAIKLLDTIYTSVNMYGMSVELRQLLDAFRTQVMVDEFLVDQNELFFAMTNYVLSEQKNPDWLFKTSYIYIKENNIPLMQDRLYTPDEINNIIDFIKDVKPYHTQIRDYTSTYLTSDIAVGTASDSYKINTVLTFGPDNMDYVDPGHWDANCEDELLPGPWDNYAWDVCPPHPYVLNALTFVDDIDQFVSREDVYTVPLTFFDATKIGLSQLFPYTFDFNSININGPQTFITPHDIVGIQVGTTVLLYGQDYYVDYNVDDDNYTVYFYNDPGNSPTPVALVWFDGGGMLHFRFNTVRNEVAYGFPSDDLVVNVDTRLPVNDVSAIDLVPPFAVQPTVSPYVGWGDIWEGVDDPVVSQILIDAGGTNEIPWDTPLTLLVLNNTISSKENTNTRDGANFYRNAERYMGSLAIDLPAPTSLDENIQVITVFVDPLTHPITTDILPDPVVSVPGVIWIGGERIEYRMKTLSAPNTWELQLVRRGTMGTVPADHTAMIPSLANPMILVPNPVWVEKNNHMPAGSDIEVWNASALPATPDLSTQTAPNEYTSIQNVPLGGMWYAQTPMANFLKDEEGTSIP